MTLADFTGPGRVASEIAELKVRGQVFNDWESVWVQQRFNDAFPLFRFTCAERDPVPLGQPGQFVSIWDKLQFRPGDSCTVKLGGQLAVTGFIDTRQVAYDANSHGVMLLGKGVTGWASKSSVLHKTGNFDGKDILTIAKEVWGPFPVGVEKIGTIDMTPFKKCQLEPGETTWDFIERLCRPRGVVLGTDEFGNFLLIGQHSFGVSQQLVEGDNILRCNCTINEQWKFQRYDVIGQGPENDEKNGPEQQKQRGTANGTASIYSYLLTVAEQPLWEGNEIVARAQNEAKWHETSDISCSVTVQGWLRDGKKLWRAGDEVIVDSPMAMMNGQKLGIEVVTFTQDRNTGTLTTLDCVNPGRLNKGPAFALGKKPAAATNATDQAVTPPPVSTEKPEQHTPQVEEAQKNLPPDTSSFIGAP